MVSATLEPFERTFRHGRPTRRGPRRRYLPMRDFKGMKRQRGRNRKSGGGANANATNPNRSWDSQGPENIKVRGNAQTVYERYQALARDAASSGDRVLAANYSQHAEHYFRVLRALQPQKSFQDIAQRETMSQGFDIDFEDESGAQAAAILAAQQAAERAQQPGQDGRQDNRQENRNDNRQDESWRDRSSDDRQDRDRNDRDDGEGGRRETRRERWERRQEERRARFEREAAEREGREPASADEGDASAPSDRASDNADLTPDGPPPSQDAAADERPRRGRGRPRREASVDAETTGADDGASLPGFLTRPTTLTETTEEPTPKPRRRRTTKADAGSTDDN